VLLTPTLFEGLHRLLDLPLVGLVQYRGYDLSILTAISQPMRFCSSVARLRQAAGK